MSPGVVLVFIWLAGRGALLFQASESKTGIGRQISRLVDGQ